MRIDKYTTRNPTNAEVADSISILRAMLLEEDSFIKTDRAINMVYMIEERESQIKEKEVNLVVEQEKEKWL
jgi:hypothetical protein